MIPAYVDTFSVRDSAELLALKRSFLRSGRLLVVTRERPYVGLFTASVYDDRGALLDRCSSGRFAVILDLLRCSLSGGLSPSETSDNEK